MDPMDPMDPTTTAPTAMRPKVRGNSASPAESYPTGAEIPADATHESGHPDPDPGAGGVVKHRGRPTATEFNPSAPGPQFDPHDPADLEQLAAHMLQRSGRKWTVPAPFEVPVDAGDPNTAWQTYPEDPAIRHYDRATRTVVDVSFPAGDSFRIFGWVFEGDPPTCRTIDRSGRFHLAGPTALAWVLSRLIDREIAGDPPTTCPGPRPANGSR